MARCPPLKELDRRGGVGQHGGSCCWGGLMAEAAKADSGGSVRKRAVLLALRKYLGEMKRQWVVALPALTLPALGNICLFYVAPLFVAALVGRLAGGGTATA